jgi:hypothetical protein
VSKEGALISALRKPDSLEDQLSALLDDRIFQDIDARFRRFNIFEAVGAVRAELRHSNFLAYLLSPSRPHGLAAEILVQFLRSLLAKIPHEKRPIGILKIVVGDLDEGVVERERDNIDILIEIKEIRLVVVIENKVGSAVSKGQLTTYKNIVRQKYPGWNHLFVLLNPDGSRPQNPEYNDQDYFTFSYGEIAQLLAKYLNERGSSLSDEVRLILENYIETLRRHVVEDTELKEIARQLYFKHKEAFDFIFESRPEPDDVLEPVNIALESDPRFVLDRPAPGVVRFALSEWSKIPELNSGPSDRWTRTKRNLLFEIQTHSKTARINISLILGPSENSLRQYIYAEASKESVFVGLVKPMGTRHSTIYVRDLLSARAAESMDQEERRDALEVAWQTFVSDSLPALSSAIAKIASSYQGSPIGSARGLVKP